MFVFPGPFAVLIRESDVCCFCGWCEVGVALLHPDFSKRTVFGGEQIVLCLCPSGVSSSHGAASTCVAHTRETFPVEPGEGLLK